MMSYQGITGIPARAFVGSKVDFIIITKDHSNKRCPKRGNHIVVQAQLNKGDVVPVEVTDNNDGSLSVSFVVEQVGKVAFSITIEGDHIKGSPCTTMVVRHRDYKTINKPRKIVTNDSKLGNPWGIAFGKDGVWAVADYSNNCVCMFDSQDKLIRSFGKVELPMGSFNVFMDYHLMPTITCM